MKHSTHWTMQHLATMLGLNMEYSPFVLSARHKTMASLIYSSTACEHIHSEQPNGSHAEAHGVPHDGASGVS